MGRDRVITKIINNQSFTTSKKYDLSGKMTKLTYPDGYFVTYQYRPGTGLLHGKRCLNPTQEIAGPASWFLSTLYGSSALKSSSVIAPGNCSNRYFLANAILETATVALPFLFSELMNNIDARQIFRQVINDKYKVSSTTFKIPGFHTI